MTDVVAGPSDSSLDSPQDMGERDESSILDATLDVAGTQLLGQIADETSLDGRTMGILGFNGALLAADIAAKDILGTLWWAPIPVVVVSAFFCLLSTFSPDTDLGPQALRFYETYGGSAAPVAQLQLLADLDTAFRHNADRVKTKRNRLRRALGTLVVGLAVAAVLLVVERPTKGGHHAHTKASHTSSSSSKARSRAFPSAPRRASGNYSA